ncbi:MAG: UDP-N-acetylmuramate dehydrogenase [Lachnospiraceae bacterium]|nr:UDP-N-acetylmuramate dehydrogenase [Lachnospiraceae bacterium]
MTDTTWTEELKTILPKGTVLTEEPMSRHTTFRVGGNADAYVVVQNIEQLRNTIAFLREKSISYFVIGNGSNLLVSDNGYRGAVLEIGREMSKISIEEDCVCAQAGALLAVVAKEAMKAELSGMEFASGIPGSIGGAIVMNAGAYDGEMKQIVREVTLLTAEGEIRTLTDEEMEFGYRTSILKREAGIVLSVKLQLIPGDQDGITAKMADFAARRREKQPLEYPSAGSTFKRPAGNFAGKLIMEAGLSGAMVGGAQVSEKHCGFVINRDNATATDIYCLMQKIQRQVKETSGINLEPEVIFLGEFE